MIGYRRLPPEQRYQSQALLETKISLRAISKVLGVSPSTISRELKRNSSNYCPQRSQRMAERRRKGIGPQKKIVNRVKAKIDRLLETRQWSPEQICACLRKKRILISHETIYRYVYQQHVEDRDRRLYLNLRRQRRWRRSAQKLKNQRQCSSRPDRVNIKKRPKIVEKRKRVGDFERDLILGKTGRVITIVDRTSKLVKIGKLNGSLAEAAHKKTVELLRGLKVYSITNDNGHEFSLHKLTSKLLKARVYFA